MASVRLFPTPIILAPMSGISDLVFRTFNRRHGCKFAFLEMINARSLVNPNRKTLDILATSDDDTPLGIQLLGNNPDYLLKSIEKLQNITYNVLDFNAACPQKKVTAKGKGAYLLKTPKKLSRLLRILVKNSPVPVTAKMRLGWDNNSSAVDIARHIEDAGVNAVFVHGRTKIQAYSGDVDYVTIRKIKKSLNIPVIASGNIFNAVLAKKMFDETGCDALLVARGALGNPWIFNEITEFLKNGKLPPPPDINAVIKTMHAHLGLYVDYYGEVRGVIKFRKFYIWYTRGMQKIKHLRSSIAQVKTKSQMSKFITKLHP
jgi:tRNA-dihydrouridine synthase B